MIRREYGGAGDTSRARGDERSSRQESRCAGGRAGGFSGDRHDESHRAHTAAILSKTNANDQWNFYQANRLKAHNLEVGHDVISILGKSAAAEKKLKEYETGIQKYEDKGKETQDAAKKFEEETEHVEAKALYFDMGEGLLEIGLVLSSLYFISRKMLFR